MVALDTVWPADSVEFCPHESAFDIFVCGTYQLEQPSAAAQVHTALDDVKGDSEPATRKQSQVRRGKCLVLQVTEDRGVSQIQEISLPAVLDQKWCHTSQTASPVLGIADSEGNVTLHEWHKEERRLKAFQSVSCAPSDVLCLSLDWSTRRYPTNNHGSLVVSLSNGSLCVLNPGSTGNLTIVNRWHAHDYEPWIAAWNYWDTSIVYSGGDDLTMKGWDVRQNFSQPIFTNKRHVTISTYLVYFSYPRRFNAGVTSIQSHPHIEYLIAVGSYDNNVCIFDTRKPLVPLVQGDVGGGAWRVKWHPSPSRKEDILVAGMHDGFKVVKAHHGEDVTWEIVKRFDDHKSLAYGADWSFAPPGVGGETLIASCSFYDHMLHLWSG
ncbi:WD-40 repeat-containing protein [Suillus weaverae]|nr:WD-40 repeat-containing protein [Suillus weaverae]